MEGKRNLKLLSACTSSKRSTNGLPIQQDLDVNCTPQAKRPRLSACTSSKDEIEKVRNSRLDDLSDDELTGVFLKLPVKLVHRLKCVCKRWLSLISDPGFARSYSIMQSRGGQNDQNNKLLIFNTYREKGGDVGAEVDILPRIQHALSDTSSMVYFCLDFIAPRIQHSVGIIGGQYETVFLEEVQFKGVCNELLLAQAIYRDSTDLSQWPCFKPVYSVFYVCNPITDHWVELPMVPVEGHAGFTCYQLQDCQDDPLKIKFTVVVVSKEKNADDDVFIIRIYFSGAADWSIFRVPFPTSYTWPNDNVMKRVFFANGLCYWRGSFCIAEYDPFNAPHRCDIIPLPTLNNKVIGFKYSGLFFSVMSQGSVRVGTNFGTERFVVWELVDHAHKLTVKYDIDMSKIPNSCCLRFESFAEDRDKIYVVKDCVLMLFDVRNKTLHHICDLPVDWGEAECDLGEYVYYSPRNVESFVLNPWPTPVPLRNKSLHIV